MKKIFRKATSLALVLLAVLVLFPATASAADKVYYMFVGDEATMSMTGNVVPNAKWTTSNSSVLRIVKQNAKSVTVEGMKAGSVKLTVYNTKKTSQKYSYILNYSRKRISNEILAHEYA